MISIIGLGLVKSSILVMYKNIFVVRKFQIVVYTVLAFVVGWTISFAFSHLFTCYPITVFIEPYYGNNCVQTVPMFFALLVSVEKRRFPNSAMCGFLFFPLTRLLVYGCYRRYHHSHIANTNGDECEDGSQEEAGSNSYAHTRRGVSALLDATNAKPLLTVQCVRCKHHPRGCYILHCERVH
jgi:hypothetical protein